MKTYQTQTRLAVLSFLMGACLMAASQVPQGISYQAVARDGGGLFANQNLVVRFTVLETPDLLPVYAETHSAVTNQYGLFSLTVGEGTPVQGTFANINWSLGFHMLQVEIDKGTGFDLLGTNLLQSTPYSFYADRAKVVDSASLAINDLTDVDAVSPNVDEVLKWNGSAFAPANDEVDDADHDPFNEIETWNSLVGIPAGFLDGVDDVNDGDADPTNEIQTLNYGGNQLTLSNGGGSATIQQGLWSASGSNAYFNSGRVGIGTSSPDPEASLHMLLPNSGNFAHLQIESPASNVGFGIGFAQPSQDWLLGQNIGNWNDGRFQIVPGGSNHWFTILSNGNVGLTSISFLTPLARFQVPQNGDMDNGGTLDVTQAAIYVGENANTGIALDHDQLESKGTALKVNHLSDEDVLLTLSDGNTGVTGGNVGIGVSAANADFHVAENRTILFGSDTLGKSNFFPDPKVMFQPGKGGAFRAGQLNADGSLIGGTGYNYWDWTNVGWASVAIGNNTRATGAGSVALGIRADARNFGAVALGHLSRTLGNSAVAAGYYTRADAFVSTAVGAGNVGGGNANSWLSTDPIFEVGNSTDTTNRSNALTVLKNGRVAINHASPLSYLHIVPMAFTSGLGSGIRMEITGVGQWETNVDGVADYNFYFNNGLKAYILDTDGSYHQSSDQRLKSEVEPVTGVLPGVLQLQAKRYRYTENGSDSPYSTGFIAQEVEPLFPDLVSEKNGLKGLNYAGFSVIAIQAIREQQAIIETLQEEINLLKQKVSEFEK